MYVLRRGLYDVKVTLLLIVLTCSRCWECLGDAYKTRGSYTTAMKAYSKAVEYDPASLYCQYQYAIIHLCIYQVRPYLLSEPPLEIFAVEAGFLAVMQMTVSCYFV